ncbi:phage tail tape measure protein [Tardiphaga sp. 71_E8_N1_1]|uniref:phage tail tape measure protein n=1 Tax=Tardiphaga sp. 71_E8_N1_1 TaxID=3240784 RepID=UPI003F887530
MGTLTSQLIVSLIDRVTGPAKTVGNSMQNLSGRIKSVTATQAAAASRLQGQMLGAVAAGYGLQKALSAPISIASEFESSLLDIGQKADLSDGSIKTLGERIRALGPLINQTSAEVAKGIDTLVGFGLDPERAETLIKPIGKAATAYKASVDDLAKAGYSALDNLKLKAEDFGKALDVMAQSGKEGAFEIKDMASEFPSLTASAQALKMEGVTAIGRLTAALQIARKGAASGSEAATNTANLMQKIISPETTKKFTKLGVDIRKELKKTQEAGGDVFEMIAGQTNKALKGDLSKLGDLFEDAQVQKFLRPLMQNLDEYKKIRDKALGAKGVVDADFARRMVTNAARTAAFTIRLKELGMSIGNILLPAMNSLMGGLAPVIKGFEKFADAHPHLVGGAVKVAASLIALRVAAIGARYAMAFMGAAALTALAPLRLLPAAIGAFAAGLVAMTRPLALATAALRVFKLALLGTGVGVALVAIGAAAAFVANNMKGIGAGFTSFFNAVKAGLDGDRFPALTAAMEKLGAAWKLVTGEIDTAKWEAWGAGAGTSVANAITGIADALDSVVQKWESFKGIWNGIQDVLNYDMGKHVTDRVGWLADDLGIRSKGNPREKTARDAYRQQFMEDRGRLGFPVINGDVFNSGSNPVQHLDGSSQAAGAGAKTGASYKQNFEAELDGVTSMIAQKMSHWGAMLGSFSASPTITPKFGPVPSGGGQKGAALNGVSARQQAAFADYGFKTV